MPSIALPPKEYQGIAEVAKSWGCSASDVLHLGATGALPLCILATDWKVAPGCWDFDEEEGGRWLGAARTVTLSGPVRLDSADLQRLESDGVVRVRFLLGVTEEPWETTGRLVEPDQFMLEPRHLFIRRYDRERFESGREGFREKATADSTTSRGARNDLILIGAMAVLLADREGVKGARFGTPEKPNIATVAVTLAERNPDRHGFGKSTIREKISKGIEELVVGA